MTTSGDRCDSLEDESETRGGFEGLFFCTRVCVCVGLGGGRLMVYGGDTTLGLWGRLCCRRYDEFLEVLGYI